MLHYLTSLCIRRLLPPPSHPNGCIPGLTLHFFVFTVCRYHPMWLLRSLNFMKFCSLFIYFCLFHPCLFHTWKMIAGWILGISCGFLIASKLTLQIGGRHQNCWLALTGWTYFKIRADSYVGTRCLKSIRNAKLQCSCVYLEHIYLLIAIIGIFMLPKGELMISIRCKLSDRKDFSLFYSLLYFQ